MDFLTILFLGLMFVGIYVTTMFILLTIQNRDKMFKYPAPNESYSITVIIPAYNEEKSIDSTIKHVVNSNYPNVKILVVNDGSTDNTSSVVKKLCKKYKNLELLDKSNSGKADSLNCALKGVKTDLFAVVDSDSFPAKNSLKKLSGYFDDKKMSAVTSFVKLRNRHDNFLTKLQAVEYILMGWSRKLLDFIDSVYVTNGPLSLYRTKFVKKIGGFDPKSITEDIDITWNLMRHGYKTSMCLDADVTTVAPNNLKSFYRQRTRWGLGGIQALFKYKGEILKRNLFGSFVIPFVMLSIGVSVIGFILLLLTVGRDISIKLINIGLLSSSNIGIFQKNLVNLTPPVILYLLIILAISSIIYFTYVLTQTKGRFEQIRSFSNFFNLLFYIFVYLAIYPIVWFSSIFRFVTGDYKW